MTLVRRLDFPEQLSTQDGELAMEEGKIPRATGVEAVLRPAPYKLVQDIRRDDDVLDTLAHHEILHNGRDR
jgi:hypothetical protein